MMKALFDKACALIGLLLTAPVILVLIPLIRLDSPGPAIFRQRRIGRRGEEFTCLKLRTMKQNTRQVGTHEITDASVTKIGRFLRKTKLDELLQLLNFFRGELSVSGQRQCLPVQVELVSERKARGVLEILPGITGLGQVKGIDMSDPVHLAKCDELYLSQMSFLYDLSLIWYTLLGAGREDRIKSENGSD